MEHTNMSQRHKQLLVCLSHLPSKMLSIHGLANITEFVLHELCQSSCFNLKKAAYFIDNPDFDCLQGVAGFSKEEEYRKNDDFWRSPEEFTEHMRSCVFNNKVRSLQRTSIHKVQGSHEHIARDLASQLSFQQPYSMLSWPLKHDNKGMLVFERDDAEEGVDEFITNGLHFLAFCPVF